MNEKNLSRWRIVTLITAITAFIFAVAYALTGYIVFGQQTEGIGNKIINLYVDIFSICLK